MGSQQSIPAPRSADRLTAWLIAAAVACLGLLPALHGWQHRHDTGSQSTQTTHACHHGHEHNHAGDNHPLADHDSEPHTNHDTNHDTDHHTDRDSEQSTDHECTTCTMIKLAVRGLLTAPAATLDALSSVSHVDGCAGPATPRLWSLSPRSSRGPPLIA